jgi:hypothetical protein
MTYVYLPEKISNLFKFPANTGDNKFLNKNDMYYLPGSPNFYLGNYVGYVPNYKNHREEIFRGMNKALKFEKKEVDGTMYYSYVYIAWNNTGYTLGIDYKTPVFGIETSAQDKLPEYIRADNIIIENKILAYKRKSGGRKWSAKYKKSINCKKPKGFSQRQHCKYGRKKTRKNRR